MTQWNFQNKGKSRWTGTSSFVLKVPLRHLRPSVIYSVPCDRILQRAYCPITQDKDNLLNQSNAKQIHVAEQSAGKRSLTRRDDWFCFFF